MYLRNYRLQKAWLIKCLKSPMSEHLWTVSMLKGPKHCLNLHGSSFVKFFGHYRRTQVRKNSGLVVSDILRLFLNILNPNDKYSVSVKVCLKEPIPMQLPIKPKILTQFYSEFLESTSNFQHFEKKMSLIADVFSRL